MSSRNKIAANTSIFNRLDKYCQSRNDNVANSGKGRWIETEADSRGFLLHSRCIGSLMISPSLAIANFTYEKQSYLITAGFETVEIPSGLVEEDLNGSILTAFLAEIAIRPSAPTVNVRQIVEISEQGVAGYTGHDAFSIASLFPPIQVFSTDVLDAQEYTNLFLLICLGDRRRHEHWIDDDLAFVLGKMATASANAIPYDLLCRAVLDIDPASLFLALYRSLEALYSREQTIALMSKLGIARDWIEIGQMLEVYLGKLCISSATSS